MDTLAERVSELCIYLNDNAITENLQVTHLLDALASCGLTLIRDDTGSASLAYLNEIK